ncbi:MAG: DUF4129 domain-containing protein [Fimbriimonadaceae bacterium]|nr:DUF4129 domain-containing protein [Fimbriimonadaceae bacterium]
MNHAPTPPELDRDPPLIADEFDPLADILLPLLLFVMLGALVWFLIDVRAAQVYAPTRLLRLIFFCFLVAVVGIARITTRDGNLNAAAYAVALLVVMGLFGFLHAFGGGAFGSGYGGQQPVLALLLNYLIIAVIWFGGNYIVRQTAISADSVQGQDVALLSSEQWEAEGADTAARRRPHPGRAVMVLSLLAVVIFGVGHKILAGHEFQGHAFGCMVVFLGSALLVLALSALNGLSIYVRTRGAAVPWSVVATWLLLALPLAALILVLAQVAPRLEPAPNSLLPQPLVNLLQRGGQESGRRAPWSDDAPGGEGRGLQGRGGTPTADRGPAGARPGGQESGGQQGQRATQGPAAGEGGAQSGGQSPGQGAGAASPQSSPPRASGQPPPGGLPSPASGSPPPPGSAPASSPPSSAAAESPPSSGGAGEPAGSSDAEPPPAPSSAPSPPPPASPGAAPPAPLPPPPPSEFGRWLGLLLLLGGSLLAIGWVGWRLWQRRGARSSEPVAEQPVVAKYVFEDPFGPRSPFRGRPTGEVVRHLYRALQAWAQLVHSPRPPDATPLAWLRQLPPEAAAWRAEIEALTELYLAVEYTPSLVDESCLPELQRIWERLLQAVKEARG